VERKARTTQRKRTRNPIRRGKKVLAHLLLGVNLVPKRKLELGLELIGLMMPDMRTPESRLQARNINHLNLSLNLACSHKAIIDHQETLVHTAQQNLTRKRKIKSDRHAIDTETERLVWAPPRTDKKSNQTWITELS
jgi:hypothetical protein